MDYSLRNVSAVDEDDPNSRKKTRVTLLLNRVPHKAAEMKEKVFRNTVFKKAHVTNYCDFGDKPTRQNTFYTKDELIQKRHLENMIKMYIRSATKGKPKFLGDHQ